MIIKTAEEQHEIPDFKGTELFPPTAQAVLPSSLIITGKGDSSGAVPGVSSWDLEALLQSPSPVKRIIWDLWHSRSNRNTPLQEDVICYKLILLACKHM